jgi:signal peptidase I
MRIRLLITAGAAALFGFLASYVRRFEAVDNSMQPNVNPGDYLVATKIGRKLPRATIVVVPNPKDPTMFLVKRAVGVAGDVVSIEGGRVGVNGQVLPEPWAAGAAAEDGSWTVGPGELFLLSDNRTVPTSDSRQFGPAKINDGAWQVRFRYWPAGRLGSLN